MKNVGIALIVIGILMSFFTGVNFIRKREVVDLGAVKVSWTERNPIYWSPITGLILIAAGGIVLLTARKKR